MTSLTENTCVPCRGGIPPLTDAEIAPLKAQVPLWEVAGGDGVTKLRRTYTFPDFRTALDFVSAVGELAEREQHHPDLHLAWGKVMMEVWTHKIGGLHQNDFILAAKADLIYSQRATSA